MCSKKRAFSRKRIFTLKTIIFALLLNAQKGFQLGYKQLISNIFELGLFPESLKALPTERAFRNAFDKLPLNVMTKLLTQTHQQEFQQTGSLYHGLKIIIPDGTKIALPKSQSVLNEFGPGQGYYPQCSAIGFFELSTGTFEDLRINHMNRTERKTLFEHASLQNQKNLYIADAGFNGIATMARILELEQQIIVPLTKCKMKKKMKISKDRSKIIEVKLTKGHLVNHPNHQQLIGEIIKVRLIRTLGTTKLESQILMTTLLDEDIFKWKELCELYRQRYIIEVAFRHLKVNLNLETIKKRKLSRVIKSIYSAVILYNLAALLRNKFKVPGLKAPKNGEKMICFSLCLKKALLFCKATIKPVRGIKKQMKICLKAINACCFTHRPWRINPRISYIPLSKFSTRSIRDVDKVKRTAEILKNEFMILGKQYGHI